jgi:hypothetical protein
MDRRGFLRLLGLGGAALVLDPERLLWVPGQKTIVDFGGIRLAEPGNTLLTIEWIAQETLRVLQHNLEFSRVMNRMYDEPMLGRTVTARRPVRYR